MNPATTTFTDPPRWMELATRVFNRPVVALQRLGVAFGPTSVLTLPGRKSGKLRAAPVAVLTVDGQRYVVAVYEGSDWVANARAAGWGMLARGRKRERVTLTELGLAQRTELMRSLPAEAPSAAGFYRMRFGIDFAPDALAGLAPKVRAFRIDRAPDA